MGIRPQNRSSRDDVFNAIEVARIRMENKILQILQYIGEYGLGYTREHGSYTDQTGNLRSSVGYIIAKDGTIKKKGGFDPNANSGTEGEDGAQDGLHFALEQLKSFSSGYVLIFVAGEIYAPYVEKRGYDVLKPTEAESKSIAKRLFSQFSK
nr:MAG TPA: hypothetical protein [Caudoviricetes sp.]